MEDTSLHDILLRLACVCFICLFLFLFRSFPVRYAWFLRVAR